MRQDRLYRELHKKLAKEIKEHYAKAAARRLLFQEKIPKHLREMERAFHRVRKRVLSKKEREKIARKLGARL